MRASLLVLLASMMMVHPLAGSGQAAGRSLAHWLRMLQCVCEHCGTGVEAGSCCSEPEPIPVEAGCEDSCSCAHTGELPLDEHAPLGTPGDGGGGDARGLSRLIDLGASASSFVPLSMTGGASATFGAWDALDPSPSCCPGCIRPRVPEHGGLCAGAVRGPIGYLALLCIARI